MTKEEIKTQNELSNLRGDNERYKAERDVLMNNAKEIINKLLELVDFLNENNVKEPIIAEAEQFLKEIKENE